MIISNGYPWRSRWDANPQRTIRSDIIAAELFGLPQRFIAVITRKSIGNSRETSRLSAGLWKSLALVRVGCLLWHIGALYWSKSLQVSGSRLPVSAKRNGPCHHKIPFPQRCCMRHLVNNSLGRIRSRDSIFPCLFQFNSSGSARFWYCRPYRLIKSRQGCSISPTCLTSSSTSSWEMLSRNEKLSDLDIADGHVHSF